MASESLAVRISTPSGRSWPIASGRRLPSAATSYSVPFTACTMARPERPPY